MSTNISTKLPSSNAFRLLAALTVMLSGRAMTIAFIGRAGGGGAGDPPLAWLMPLWGDAVVGVTALLVLALLIRRAGLFGWTAVVVWNVVAIWDALSALVIHLTVPWPEFFMTQIFGSSMFFMASAMHLLCIYLVTRPALRDTFFVLKSSDADAGVPA